MSIKIDPEVEAFQTLFIKLFTKAKMYLEFSELSEDQSDLYSIFKEHMTTHNKTFMEMAESSNYSHREVQSFLNNMPTDVWTEYFLLRTLNNLISDPKVHSQLTSLLDKKKAIEINHAITRQKSIVMRNNK